MKKYLATILTALMFFAMPITAYATEGKPPSFKCNVTFYITDETADGYPGSSFTANMKDNTGTITDSYRFTKGNSWGNGRTPKYTMTAPATYTVTFEGLEEGYAVINTLDRSENITFNAMMDGTADVLWSIIETETEAADKEGSGSGSGLLEQGKDGNFSVSNEGAEEVYKNFLSATAFIADNTGWYNALLKQYEWFPHAERYVEYVENGTEEEYLAMSLYDRFVWSESYLIYAWAVNSGNVNNYFGNRENFASHITNDIVKMMEGAPNYEAVKTAYLALADWQYSYVQENGVPFNFINNRSYLEEVKEVPETEVETKSDKEELSEAAKELLEDADKTTKKEVKQEKKEKGIWDDTIESLARNIITIAIIVILCIAVGVVVWKRKRLNMEDNRDGDTNIDSTHDK